MVFEGQEKKDFWNVLGGKEDYASDKRLQVREITQLYLSHINTDKTALLKEDLNLKMLSFSFLGFHIICSEGERG